MAEYENLIYETAGTVADIRFNRPHRLNAVIEGLYTELLDALAAAEADPAVRVIQLSGEGRAFCVGADLKAHASGERTPFQRRQYLQLEQRVCRRIRTISKPVVAVVQGYALGAGAELAVACDFLLMADTAQIGLPEVGLATFLGGGITYILPQLVGLARARELVFLGERIDGTEAHRLGLANRVFPEASLREDARAVVEKIGSKAPLSMALAKEQLNSALERGFDAALVAELEGMTFCATSRDWREGVEAFRDKRDPVYTGE